MTNARPWRNSRVSKSFEMKESGERKTFGSGMQRDVDTGKLDYTLVFDGPLVDRVAAHLTAGARRYSPRNWMRASTTEERDRFMESAARHFRQWLRGDRDEDHFAAVVFNMNGYEYVRDRLEPNYNITFPAYEVCEGTLPKVGPPGDAMPAPLAPSPTVL